MKHNLINSLAFTALASMMMAGCGKNIIEFPADPDQPIRPNVPVEINGYMMNYPVWGTVTDAQGHPLSGVIVQSGSSAVFSDEYGYFYLESIDNNDGRPIVKFTKEGYFPVVRSCYIGDDTKYGWDVAMNPKSGASTASARFNASDSRKLDTGTMSVTLPANAYYDKATGSRYTGTVNAEIFYLSPDSERFTSLMPGGDLAATTSYIRSSADDEVLVSYGMVNVQLSDTEGNPLQISGAPAEVSFPTPTSMADGAPDMIPLWGFDEALGLWVKDGEATRNSQGNYVATTSLYTSWWNIDDPRAQAWIEGDVMNEDGRRLSDIEIVFNKQLRVRTDEKGHYRKLVVANTQFEVWVPSETYGDYTPEFREQAGPIASGSTLPYNIILPTLHRVYGKVVDSNDNPINGAYQITYPGGKSEWTPTDLDGNFSYYLRPGTKGEGSISVTTGRGGIDNQKFDIPGNSDVELYLKIGSGIVVPGDPDIVADCGNNQVYYLTAGRIGENTVGGVIVETDWLTALPDMNEEEQTRAFMLQIPGYTPDKNEYSSFTFMALDRNQFVQCSGGTLRIDISDGVYYFNLTGQGYYAGYNSSTGTAFESEAEITVNNVGISHLMTIERRENYTPASPFPSVTPKLSTPAPVALVITESRKLGTGGLLLYNGALSDYNSLVSQADGSGYTRLYNEVDDRYAESMYRKGNSMISIDWDSEIDPITSSSWAGQPLVGVIGDDEESDDSYVAQLTVTAFNGGTLSLDDLYGETSLSRSAATHSDANKPSVASSAALLPFLNKAKTLKSLRRPQK